MKSADDDNDVAAAAQILVVIVIKRNECYYFSRLSLSLGETCAMCNTTHTTITTANDL